jgi:TfoX/Sxy family transcriptional regulator of competence genes
MSETPQSSKGMWSAVPAERAKGFTQALAAFPEVDLRQMFGCPCAFANGKMFAVFHPAGLALKLSAEDREALLQTPGAKPFEPMPGRKMREYVVLPEDLVSLDDQLGTWLRRAHTYAASLPPKRSQR